MRLHDELIERLTEDPNDVTCLYCMAGVAALHGDGESALAQLDTVLAQSPYFVEFAYHDLAWQPYEDDERFQRMVMSRFTADDPVSTDSTVKQ